MVIHVSTLDILGAYGLLGRSLGYWGSPKMAPKNHKKHQKESKKVEIEN